MKSCGERKTDDAVRERKSLFLKKNFERNDTLQLKGIAIIMMLFHHLFGREALFKNYAISFFPLNKEFVVNMSLSFKICVSIFVFITGYGLTLSLKKLYEGKVKNKHIFKWTSERLIKTLSGFWIIAILSYIICQIIDGRTGTIFFKERYRIWNNKNVHKFYGIK